MKFFKEIDSLNNPRQDCEWRIFHQKYSCEPSFHQYDVDSFQAPIDMDSFIILHNVPELTSHSKLFSVNVKLGYPRCYIEFFEKFTVFIKRTFGERTFLQIMKYLQPTRRGFKTCIEYTYYFERYFRTSSTNCKYRHCGGTTKIRVFHKIGKPIILPSHIIIANTVSKTTNSLSTKSYLFLSNYDFLDCHFHNNYDFLDCNYPAIITVSKTKATLSRIATTSLRHLQHFTIAYFNISPYNFQCLEQCLNQRHNSYNLKNVVSKQTKHLLLNNLVIHYYKLSCDLIFPLPQTGLKLYLRKQ